MRALVTVIFALSFTLSCLGNRMQEDDSIVLQNEIISQTKSFIKTINDTNNIVFILSFKSCKVNKCRFILSYIYNQQDLRDFCPSKFFKVDDKYVLIQNMSSFCKNKYLKNITLNEINTAVYNQLVNPEDEYFKTFHPEYWEVSINKRRTRILQLDSRYHKVKTRFYPKCKINNRQ
jgi:hypothetical protein